jgi:uncharacterized protein YodC (DUF2158 family)
MNIEIRTGQVWKSNDVNRQVRVKGVNEAEKTVTVEGYPALVADACIRYNVDDFTKKFELVGTDMVDRSTTAFKLGDVVVLKSGGPPMTVVKIRDIDPKDREYADWIVVCMWFTTWGENEKLCDQSFPVTALELAAKEQQDAATSEVLPGERSGPTGHPDFPGDKRPRSEPYGMG